jgi:hypothetical protein
VTGTNNKAVISRKMKVIDRRDEAVLRHCSQKLKFQEVKFFVDSPLAEKARQVHPSFGLQKQTNRYKSFARTPVKWGLATKEQFVDMRSNPLESQ